MNIVRSYPPNIAKIRAKLGSKFMAGHGRGAYYCYGDTIYNPSGNGLTRADIAHEHTHSIRQGKDPEAWWDRWLSDVEFRVLEELIAHRVEFRVAVEGANRHQRRAALTSIAQRLAGPLYGNAMNIATAKRLISEEPTDVSADDMLNAGCIPPGTVVDAGRSVPITAGPARIEGPLPKIGDGRFPNSGRPQIDVKKFVEALDNVGNPGAACGQCGANAPMPMIACRDPACPHVVREIEVAA